MYIKVGMVEETKGVGKGEKVERKIVNNNKICHICVKTGHMKHTENKQHKVVGKDEEVQWRGSH
jgi:hypothetical protein